MPAAQRGPRQRHGGGQARASRKHAAKPDSASRKQHRPGQQGLHCRAASQAPSSTNGTHDHRRAIRAACSAPGSLSRATGHRIGSGSLHCQAAPQVAFPCATAAVPSSPSARRSATHARGPRQDPHGARRHRTTAAAAANVAYLEGRRPIVRTRTQQHNHEKCRSNTRKGGACGHSGFTSKVGACGGGGRRVCPWFAAPETGRGVQGSFFQRNRTKTG